MNRAAAVAFVATLAGFVFCAIASAYGWHPAFTRPLTVVFVLAAIGCAVWLNWTAGDDGEGDPEDLRDRPECPYENCGHNHPERERGQS